MSDSPFNIEMVFGYARIEQRPVFKGGRMSTESRRVDYNQSGSIRATGEWEITGASIGWDDGSPFTPSDYKSLSESA